MKKLFDRIDHLCKHAQIPNICYALGLAWTINPDQTVTVRLPGQELTGTVTRTLPGASNLRWRRMWRSFLTDHVDSLRPIAGEEAAAGRGELPCAIV